MLKVTEAEERIILNALYTAADKYRDCAKEVGSSSLPPVAQERLAAQFKKQADECSELIEKMEG